MNKSEYIDIFLSDIVLNDNMLPENCQSTTSVDPECY